MSPRTLKIGLWISVTLNVLVVGAVVGALALAEGGSRLPNPDRDGPRRGGPPELQAFTSALERPRRQELRDRLRADPTLRDGRARIADGRRAVIDALRAEPFDPEALRTAFAGQRAVQQELADRGLDALVSVIAGLTPAERVAFVEDLERRMRRPSRP